VSRSIQRRVKSLWNRGLGALPDAIKERDLIALRRGTVGSKDGTGGKESHIDGEGIRSLQVGEEGLAINQRRFDPLLRTDVFCLRRHVEGQSPGRKGDKEAEDHDQRPESLHFRRRAATAEAQRQHRKRERKNESQSKTTQNTKEEEEEDEEEEEEEEDDTILGSARSLRSLGCLRVC